MRMLSGTQTALKTIGTSILAVVILNTLFPINLNAQSISSTSYPMTTASGVALEDISTGSTQLIGPNVDDGSGIGLVSIGFDFWFTGIRYTQFAASVNGYMRLGADINGGGSSIDYSNSLASTNQTPVIAAYWDDIYTGTNGKVHYKVVGAAPNRKLVVEWNNMQIPYAGAGSSGAGNFQLWLTETSGKIEFVYGNGIVVNSSESGYSCGMAYSASIYASVLTSNNTVSYGSGVNNTQTNAISAGTQYTFNPVATIAGPSNLSFSYVSSNSMTLNWSAASPTTNIVRYTVYASTNGGTTYSYMGETTNNSTVVFTANNLLTGTTYMWRVYSVSQGALSAAFAQGNQATVGCSIPGGTFSVGPTGNYATLTAAQSALKNSGIAGPVILELQAAYSSSGESFPLTFKEIACSGPSNTITVRPALGATGLSITSSSTTGTLLLDSADYYIIDGRPGGVGTTSQLTISNSSTGYAIRFVNDATNNIVRYITASSGATSTSSGVIVISTTNTGGSGNDDNTIDNCDLSGNGAAANVIYAFGTTSAVANYNNGVTISNNKIHDQFLSGGTTSGIYVSVGNTDWTITGNSLYQTSTRTYTAGAFHYGIVIGSSTAGNNFIITNNIIGGSNATATGTAWTASGAVASRFVGIYLSVASSTPSSVQNNTITNFNWTTSSNASTLPGVWCGIYLASGLANIGTTTGNIIGAATGTGSIQVTVTVSGTGGISVGIGSSSTSAGNMGISNNTIGSVTAAASQVNLYQLFNGIWNAGALAGNLSISNNLIGSTSTPNSIQFSTVGTGTAPTLTGILQSGSVIGPNVVNISNNTLANFYNAYGPSVSTTGSMIRGINVTSGRTSITGNTIRNFSTSARNSGTGINASVLGIGNTSTSSPGTLHEIRSNVIHSLSNNNSAYTVHVSGIYWNGPASGGVIEKNLVYGLSSTGNTVLLNGIQADGQAAIYQNNMIGMGAGINSSPGINGILETGGTNTFFHNTIVVVGNVETATNNNTYAYNNSVSLTSARTIRNNIFINERTNSASSSKHYSIRNSGNTTGLTIDNNIYRATGAGAVFGSFNGADVADLAAWKGATGQDASSLNADPCMVDRNGATPNLHLTNCNGAGNPADGAGFDMGVVDDFDGEIRSGLTPVDIGADAGDYRDAGRDIGLLALVAPAGVGCFSNAEPVTVTLKNYDVSTIVFSVNPVTVTVTATGPTGSYNSSLVISSGSLASNATMNVTLPATYNMTARGTYIFNGSASVAGDMNSTNDTLPTTNRVNNSLSGTYTVGTGGDFNTLTAAISAYNSAACLNGPVIFSLVNTSPYNTANGETFPIIIYNNTSANATNSLTIKPAFGVTTNITSAVSSNQIFKILGSHVLIDGSNNGTSSRDLTISNTGTSSPHVILIGSTGTSPVTNITLKNCIIINGLQTYSAVLVSDGTTAGSAGYFNNITIMNNSIQKAYMGILSRAVVTPGNGNGFVVTGNSMVATGTNAISLIGIYLEGVEGATVSDNSIGNFLNSIDDGMYGIWLASGTRNTVVSGNVITNINQVRPFPLDPIGIYLSHNIPNANIEVLNNTISGLSSISSVSGYGTGVVAGIELNYNSGGIKISGNRINNIKNSGSSAKGAAGIRMYSFVTSNAANISNNFIWDITSIGGEVNGHGIRVDSGADYNIYHNTIDLRTNQTNPSTIGTAPLWVGAGVVNSGAINAVNNIFGNTKTASDKNYAIYSEAPASVFGTLDYNNYYSTGANLAFIGGINRSNLAALQAGFGGNANSRSVEPIYISSTDLHLDPNLNPNLNNKGIALGLVPTDIDGETRNAITPDLGADEFDPTAAMVNVSAFLEGYYTGASTMAATLYDLGISAITNETDTIEVNLWSPSSLSNPSPNYSAKVVLHTNGMASGAVFPGATLGNSYYIAIKHRNSMETWSAAPVMITATTNYDFTSSLSATYGDGFNAPMKSMGGGKYALYSGDVNQDGTVDALDLSLVENDAGDFSFGYNVSDCTGDGATDALDQAIIENSAQLFLFYARPY